MRYHEAPKIRFMRPGDAGWTVPWAVVEDAQVPREHYIYGLFPYYPRPGGTKKLWVKKTEAGIILNASRVPRNRWPQKKRLNTYRHPIRVHKIIMTNLDQLRNQQPHHQDEIDAIESYHDAHKKAQDLSTRISQLRTELEQHQKEMENARYSLCVLLDVHESPEAHFTVETEDGTTYIIRSAAGKADEIAKPELVEITEARDLKRFTHPEEQ